jgi:2'-hydroxyisoflavone reductase
MTLSRRSVLESTCALGALWLAPQPLAAAARLAPRQKKRILILGGTGFIGPKTVSAALQRGHSVTVFNRGRTEKRIPFEFKDVEHLYGNRDPLLPADDERDADGKLLRPDASPKGLEQLEGRRWDAVIDNSGYYPRMVKASSEMLAKSCGQYIFISSISAYASSAQRGGDEDAPLAELSDPTVEDMGPGFANYGGLKVACERAAQAAFPDRCAIVRPGFIVGPGDPTDRFSYWPVRIDRGGKVLAPGTPEDPVQWIDSRDLGEWLVKLVENGTAGTFNAIGAPARWGTVLQTCVEAASKPAELVWVDSEWLSKNATGPRDNFPIWVPNDGDTAGFHTWKNDRALAAGLTTRSLEDTVRATLAWFPSEIERRVRVTKELTEQAAKDGKPTPKLPDPLALKAGPSPERETELLAQWAAASK